MAYLCAYLIEGTPVSELNSYSSEDLNSNPAFIAADVVPTGYQGISSIENWDKFGSSTGRDYKYLRVQIYILVATTGWANLTLDEKEIAARWFVVAQSQREEVYSLADQITLGKIHHKNSIEARTNRHTCALMELFNRLEKSDAQALLIRLESLNLLRLYVEYGIEGTIEGDVEGVMDYLHSRTGTSFDADGFLEESFTPTAGTLADIKDSLVDIITNGLC